MKTLLALASVLLLVACSSTVPNRDTFGDTFPSVVGESLDGRTVALPEDFDGEPVVVLIGYVMETQFDVDRWIYGLLGAGTPVRVIEVPTIPGLVPSFLSDNIDAGMRAGIPEQDWSIVVTVYGRDAERLRDFTGNVQPRNARAFLLDENGRVIYFHDAGFSARELALLDGIVRTRAELRGP